MNSYAVVKKSIEISQVACILFYHDIIFQHIVQYHKDKVGKVI